MPEHLDPRIAPIFRSRPKHERLMAHLMCSLLTSVDPEVLDNALATFEDLEVDWSERMFIHGGHPKTLLDFNGSSAAVMRRDGYSKQEIQKVKDAYERRGMIFPEGQLAPLAEEDKPPMPKVVVQRKPQEQRAPAAEPSNDSSIENPDEEPSFAGRKISELLGKNDNELLAIEGISKATIAKIREAEAARKPQE